MFCRFRGFHDMSPVATSAGFKRHSLKALSGLLLGHSISKKQQKSNWDKAQLTSAQVCRPQWHACYISHAVEYVPDACIG